MDEGHVQQLTKTHLADHCPTSPRMRSPIPSGSPSTPTASSRTVYRPGFQPKGVYRPLTDDFLSMRRQKREMGRVERTRLERRLEKLVELHFPRDDEGEKTTDVSAEGKGKGKERPQAPARRASSFFEIDFSELRAKSASDIWRGVLESRASAANGGKGDVRGMFSRWKRNCLSSRYTNLTIMIAAEQNITPWEDDADVAACPLCT